MSKFDKQNVKSLNFSKKRRKKREFTKLKTLCLKNKYFDNEMKNDIWFIF